MDAGAFDYLQGLLPDPVLTLLQEHVLRPEAPLHLLSNAVAVQVARGADAVRPYTGSLSDHLGNVSTMATPLLDRATRAAYNAPDVVVLGFMLLLLVLVVQVLSLLRRLVAWWTRLALRLLFWSGVVLAVAAVWQRGLEQSVQDTAVIAGRLAGYGAFVRDIWQSEYQRYQQQQALAQATAHGQAYAASGAGAGRGGWSGR